MNYTFNIRRKLDAPIERINIDAQNSHEAVNKLPPCVYWDFARTQWLVLMYPYKYPEMEQYAEVLAYSKSDAYNAALATRNIAPEWGVIDAVQV